jgi:predicted AAA+ superfamily ATPase
MQVQASIANAPSENQEWAKLLATAACWAQAGNSYFPVNDVVKTIPPGGYRCMIANQGPYLEKMQINIDNLLNLPDSATEKILEEFSQFWKLKPAFDKRGFTFKRGILMWGPPGSGKTSAVWQMTERLVKEKNGVVIFVEQPQLTVWLMGLLRRIEPDRPVVTVMEDIDAIIAQHGEHQLLALLDGEFQTNNVVHVATTNYPHLLDRRFVDRPSRFDTIMKIGMPSEDARRVYLKVKEPELDSDTIERWVRKSDGYSVAHLREICIAIQCFGQDEDAVFSRLDTMRQPNSLNIDESGENLRKRAGFLSDMQIKKVRG